MCIRDRSSWVKSVVAPSGLTRHEAGVGSCHREIRVVLGFLLILQTSLLYYHGTMLYSISQISLYCIVGCRWQHVISVTWIPGSITFHHAPIHYNAIRTHAKFQLSDLALVHCRLWMITCNTCHLGTGVTFHHAPIHYYILRGKTIYTQHARV